nr:MAG TPA: hypothetical protein [Caudoviricetes sp.]
MVTLVTRWLQLVTTGYKLYITKIKNFNTYGLTIISNCDIIYSDNGNNLINIIIKIFLKKTKFFNA